MPDFGKFLKSLGIGDKQTFKSSNTTVKFDKQGNPIKPIEPQLSAKTLENIAMRAGPIKKEPALKTLQATFSTTRDKNKPATAIDRSKVKSRFNLSEPQNKENFEDLKRSAAQSLSAKTEPKKPLLKRIVSAIQHGQLQRAKEAVSRYQEAHPKPEKLLLSPEMHITESEEAQVQQDEQPKKKRFFTRAVERLAASQRARAQTYTKNSTLLPPEAQPLEGTASAPDIQGTDQESAFENSWKDFADNIPQSDKSLEKRAKIARIKELAEAHTAELAAKEAANPDMIPDEKHRLEGTLHEADPGSIVNHPRPEGIGTEEMGGTHVGVAQGHKSADEMLETAWQEYGGSEFPFKEPEKNPPKRPIGKGTAYMGGAHVEVAKGYTRQSADKQTHHAWEKYAKAEIEKDLSDAQPIEIKEPETKPEQSQQNATPTQDLNKTLSRSIKYDANIDDCWKHYIERIENEQPQQYSEEEKDKLRAEWKKEIEAKLPADKADGGNEQNPHSKDSGR